MKCTSPTPAADPASGFIFARVFEVVFGAQIARCHNFMIEKLDADADYEATVNGAGYHAASVPVKLRQSLNMGSIVLDRQVASDHPVVERDGEGGD